MAIPGNGQDRAATCTFTGHRASKLPWGENEEDPRCRELKVCIYDTLESLYGSGARHFICGMASGADFYFCEAVLELRRTYEGVTLEAAVPCPEQAANWAEPIRKRYDRLLAYCDFRTLIAAHYTRDCMLRRNRYMVDASKWLIAVYNGASGGTQATLLYAMRQGLHVLQLPVRE